MNGFAGYPPVDDDSDDTGESVVAKRMEAQSGGAAAADGASMLDDSTRHRIPGHVAGSADDTSLVDNVAAEQTVTTPAASTGAIPDHIRAMLDDNNDDDFEAKDQFTKVFDLVEQIEELVDESKPSIFSGGQVRLDRDELTSLLNELKSKLPVQLERASALMRESERRLESAQSQSNAIIASAQSRAATIVREANEQAQFLASQENVVAIATDKARTILNRAQDRADRLSRGADEYSTRVLNELADQLSKAQQGVQNGLSVLAERQRQAAADMPHLNDDDYPRD